MDERPLGHNSTISREQAWIPSVTVNRLREVAARYLTGRHDVDGDVEQVAVSLAKAAHDGGYAPERILIALRELWRDFGLSQHDRLQLASLYDRLVRRSIDRYYQD